MDMKGCICHFEKYDIMVIVDRAYSTLKAAGGGGGEEMRFSVTAHMMRSDVCMSSE